MSVDNSQRYLEGAKASFEEGAYRHAFDLLRWALINNPKSKAGYELAVKVLRALGEEEEAMMFEEVLEAADEAEPYYHLGYHYIDCGQYDLAAALLGRCAELAPDSPEVNHELGYALMKTSRFAEAISAFHRAFALEEDFPTAFSLSRCYALTNAVEEAEEYMRRAKRLAVEDDHRELIAELRGIITRLRRFPPSGFKNIRDWHFIEYGGSILNLAEEEFGEGNYVAGGRYVILWSSYQLVGRILTTLVRMMKRLSYRPRFVLSHGEPARPLSWAVSMALDIPIEEFDPWNTPRERGILITARSEDLGDIVDSLRDHSENLAVFSFSLCWTKDQLVVPEIAGLMSQVCFLPWDEQMRAEYDRNEGRRRIVNVPKDPRPPQEIARNIWGACDGSREEDELARILNYYSARRDFLFFNNSNKYPKRAYFSLESPVSGAKFV
ncbi:MAG: tetratricopeptide repeat protein [bacterium]